MGGTDFGAGPPHRLPAVYVAWLAVESVAARRYAGLAYESLFGRRGSAVRWRAVPRGARARATRAGGGCGRAGAGGVAGLLVASDDRRGLCARGADPGASAAGAAALAGRVEFEHAEGLAALVGRVAVRSRPGASPHDHPYASGYT